MTSTRHGTRLARQLIDLNASINLVFHNIIEASLDTTESRYDATPESFARLVALCEDLDICQRTRLYFDDNHLAQFELFTAVDLSAFQEVVAAVPVTSIGQPGRATAADLDDARNRGVRVAPHGHSHVRLASYNAHGTCLPTPLGGAYAACRSGVRRRLTENQVLFQLVESREHFHQPGDTEFVLPYGCYNSTTLALNQRLGLYTHLTTTDFALDTRQELRPRLLIEATDTTETVTRRLMTEVDVAWSSAE